jgi:hypothetical protein
MIFEKRIDVVTTKAIGILRVIHIGSERARFGIKTIQPPVVGANPKYATSIHEKGGDPIGRYTVWVIRIIHVG